MYSLKKRCAYEDIALKNATNDVRKGIRTVSDASRYHNVPRSTLDHRIKGRHGEKYGGKTKLSEDDESALVDYIQYMDVIGHPLGIAEVKTFAWSISKRSTTPDCFGDKGPSHKWWRCFRERHKNLTLRKPDKLDRRRNNTAKRSVVRKHFQLLKETLEKANLLNRPEHIFNVDETGIEMNKGTRKVVVNRGSKKHHQESVGDREHITANVCCSASGFVLPPMIIFQKCFPSSDYSSSGPDGCLYAKSESGYMDGELFQQWFEKIFLSKTAHLRPSMLILDGHSSHLTIDLIDLARKNDVILYCLPPHLTYLLQPLDVAVFKSLKDYFTRYSHQVKLVSMAAKTILTVNRSNFTTLFREAFEACMILSTLKNGFRKCGISPFNPYAIDWSQLQADETNEATCSAVPSIPRILCAESPAAAAVNNHPLVENMTIPDRLTEVLLIPHFEERKKVTARISTTARVLTSDQHRELLQKKLNEKAEKEAGKIQRREMREKRRVEKETQKLEKQRAKEARSTQSKATTVSARASKRIASHPPRDYAKIAANRPSSESESEAEDKICNRCGEEDPPGNEASIDWLECEACQRWYHKVCEFPDLDLLNGPIICERC